MSKALIGVIKLPVSILGERGGVRKRQGKLIGPHMAALAVSLPAGWHELRKCA